jgi:maltose/moltooligosaccharide transporter
MSTSRTKDESSADGNRWLTLAGLGAAFCLSVVVTQVIGRFLPLVLQDPNGVAVGGVGAFLAMTLVSLDNLVQLVVQPWSGRRSDRTRTRFGRRGPWIIGGTLLTSLGLAVIGLGTGVPNVIAGLLFTSLGVSLLRAPAVALAADRFRGAGRALANGRIRGIGVTLNLLIMLCLAALLDQSGLPAVFVAAAAFTALLATFAVATVAEPATPTDKQSKVGRRPWPSAALPLLLVAAVANGAYGAYNYGATSYGAFHLGLDPAEAVAFSVAIGVAFALAAAPAGRFAERRGNRDAILVGLLLWTLSFFAAIALDGGGTAGFVALNLAFGVGFAFFNIGVLTAAMNLGGADEVGRYTGLLFLFSQTGVIAGALIAGASVHLAGDRYAILPACCLAFAVSAVAFAMRLPRALTTKSDREPKV